LKNETKFHWKIKSIENRVGRGLSNYKNGKTIAAKRITLCRGRFLEAAMNQSALRGRLHAMTAKLMSLYIVVITASKAAVCALAHKSKCRFERVASH
jgi:hypothetical protein